MSWDMSIKDAKIEKFNLEDLLTRLIEGFEQSLDLQIKDITIKRWRDDEPNGNNRIKVNVEVKL